MSGKKPCLYTIPAGLSFVDMLAQGILDKADPHDPLALARMHILLPTRRAARSLREAFLRLRDGAPLLLPRMEPLGDVDEEELSLSLMGMSAEDELSFHPAIAPLQRIFLLTRLIAAQGHGKGIEQDMALAQALARLMDQVYTEDLDLADLPAIVDRDKFAGHWQISLDFLALLSEHWPKILTENGVMDAADRRNQLLKKLGAYWQVNPPQYPVIAAGTTGSIPATAALLKVIMDMKDGCIVLPGLDQHMDKDSWDAIDDTHPQATLRNLLGTLGKSRDDVALWPACPAPGARAEKMRLLTSEIMRPAETAQEWQSIGNRLSLTEKDLSIERYDCATPQEEALTIALAMRGVLEQAGKTAALVTPDRKLARRVAMACRRWGIEIDDSGGQSLSETRVGTYLRLCMEALCRDMRPVALLDFCKHALCAPSTGNWRGDIRALDMNVMRGPAFSGGMESYRRKTDDPAHIRTLEFIERAFAPLHGLTTGEKEYSLETWCVAHLEVAENFCDPSVLWAGQDGEAAATLFANLREAGAVLPPLTAEDYLSILQQAMKSVPVRPSYGLHPRLMILGQLEARLVEADITILSGLNEGTWPPAPAADPWMSRPMRKRFGLPPAERGIGLSAHDFAQNIAAEKIILTRSLRVDGTPTVPSRWLQRMDTVLKACGLDPLILRRGSYLSLARAIDRPGAYKPFDRPAPRPPVEARPRKMSVTKIDAWMKDPYGIYAQYILDLKALKKLEEPLDAAMRGTLIHAVLDQFVQKYPDFLPDDAATEFLRIAKAEMESMGLDPDVRAFWEPRLAKIAAWLVSAEEKWRSDMKPAAREKFGTMAFYGPAGEFILRGIADRIDESRDGKNGAIIDYKSGGTFSPKGMISGQYPQLPLEALMLESGGFEEVEKRTVTKLSYWIVNGSKGGGSIITLDKPGDLVEAKENARAGLESLIAKFDSPSMPYYSLPRPEYAPRYNDYEHLARVREWAALDEEEAA